ncbi:HDIG domain-containing protein [Paenibacillus pasadenensis]|uniref:HD family phosphohydrolase n=1 Tax=Paenibacillus pasadenensis TaxID=217090 RepID=UPI00203AAADD|nr:HDIG domain-containing metalloprotein [Paenibacillus pasadenensis]MCM3746363.1 HDIG domain-containing protein [Paenibacillus pasadenensis]
MSRNKEDSRSAAEQPSWAASWKQSTGIRLALCVLFVLLFYFNLSPHLVPQTYNITLNEESNRDIVASKSVEDRIATAKAQEQAAESVEPISSSLPLKPESILNRIFNRVELLNQDEGVSASDKIEIYQNEIPSYYLEYIDEFVRTNTGKADMSDELLAEMSRVAKAQSYSVPAEVFYKLPSLTAAQLTEMRQVAINVARKLSAEPIREAEAARSKVAELVNASSLTQRSTREIVQELARMTLMPNKFLDTAATEEARQLARENTTPVIIKEGGVVVKKGELITQEKYDMLEGAGLLGGQRNYLPQIGLLLTSLLFLSVIVVYLYQTGRIGGVKPRYNNMHLFMLWLILVLNFVMMQATALAQSSSMPYVGYLAPAAVGTMLITLLLDKHLAIVSSFIFAIMGSIIFNHDASLIFDFKYGFVISVVSFSAIFTVHRASQRSAILKAGIMASLFGTVTVLAVLLLGTLPDRSEILYSLGFAFASGLITAVLVIGLMPFFELSFGILSALKLVELSSPNHPLLRKLLTETPGTYHHSVMVGNLSEAAAEAIGADGLLCRVGSFYHDIGKTKRPNYFIENQSNMENPHDSMDPKLSKSIIVAHARDGVEMLKQHNIPKPLRDIAEQHHGTTSLKFFYFKAVKQAEEDGIEPDFTEDDFRYPGPKAQSKEAAIVGIADCVEAAVRSLRNPTMENVESMIQKIIKSRLDDGQFNECDLTLKELDKIGQTLKEAVIGIFHSRIEYPEEVKTKEKLA